MTKFLVIFFVAITNSSTFEREKADTAQNPI